MAIYGETICCDRCGQAIKNIYDFGGKQYGAECIQSIIGFMPNQRNADKAVMQRDRDQIAMSSHIDRVNAIRGANAPYILVMNAAREDGNFFAERMEGLLQTVPFSELSEKQQQAILKICKKYV